MPSEARYRIESHPSAATLYVSGPLTVAGARCAARLCDHLPGPVTSLRVDLTATRLADTTPVSALAMLLARWRRLGNARRTSLRLPPPARRPQPPAPTVTRSRPTRPTRPRRRSGEIHLV